MNGWDTSTSVLLYTYHLHIQLYFGIRFWPVCRHQHVILHPSAKCSNNRTIIRGVVTSHPFSIRRPQGRKSTSAFRFTEWLDNKKYVLWNVYLPNVVAFYTPFSKYLTIIVMTLSYVGSKLSKAKHNGANRKRTAGFQSDLHWVQRRISHGVRDISCQSDVTYMYDGSRSNVMVPIDSPYVVSYSTCIDPMVLSITNFDIFDV